MEAEVVSGVGAEVEVEVEAQVVAGVGAEVEVEAEYGDFPPLPKPTHALCTNSPFFQDPSLCVSAGPVCSPWVDTLQRIKCKHRSSVSEQKQTTQATKPRWKRPRVTSPVSTRSPSRQAPKASKVSSSRSDRYLELSNRYSSLEVQDYLVVQNESANSRPHIVVLSMKTKLSKLQCASGARAHRRRRKMYSVCVLSSCFSDSSAPPYASVSPSTAPPSASIPPTAPPSASVSHFPAPPASIPPTAPPYASIPPPAPPYASISSTAPPSVSIPPTAPPPASVSPSASTGVIRDRILPYAQGLYGS